MRDGPFRVSAMSSKSDLSALTANDRRTIDAALCLAAAMCESDHLDAMRDGRTSDAREALKSIREFRELGETFGRFNAEAR